MAKKNNGSNKSGGGSADMKGSGMNEMTNMQGQSKQSNKKGESSKAQGSGAQNFK